MPLPSRLSDDELIAAMNRFANCERRDVASLIGHLIEFDSRQLHLALGYGSLFRYCREVLKLSEHEALRRIEVARIARTCPLVLEKLSDGSVNLTTVDLIGPHLRPDNCAGLLDKASGKTKFQVQELVAELAPKPDIPPTVWDVPEQSISPPVSAAPALGAPPPSPPGFRQSTKPLSPGRKGIAFTVADSTLVKLKQAQDLLRHVIPSGDYGEIFDRALTLLLKDLERKRYGLTNRPRPGRKTKRGRYIPAAVKRAVHERDGGRCAFIGKNGRRCDETSCLQYHHVDPRGPSTVENIQLRCAAHNRYEADLVYGPTKLKYATVSERRARYRAPPAARSGPSSALEMGASTSTGRVRAAAIGERRVSYLPVAATRSRPSRRCLESSLGALRPG